MLSVKYKQVLLGLGGNIGNVTDNMYGALKILGDNANVEINKVSSIYETPPWGIAEQPVFLNICALVSTTLDPRSLLQLCLDAERALKRERIVKWGPRTVDVDILLMEGIAYNSQELTIPHPRIRQRAFVLVPLAQIAAHWDLDGKSIGRWRQECDDEGIIKIQSGIMFDNLLSAVAPQG